MTECRRRADACSRGDRGPCSTAKALGARGGAAKSTRVKLVSALGLTELAEDDGFRAKRGGEVGRASTRERHRDRHDSC